MNSKFPFYKTLQFNFFIYLLLIAIIPILFLNIFYYKHINDFIKNKTIQYQKEILNQMGDKLEDVLNQAEIAQNHIISFTVNRDLTFAYGKKIFEESTEYSRQTGMLMSDLKRSLNYIYEIYIVDHKKEIFASRGIDRARFLEQEWIHTRGVDSVENFIIPTHTINYRIENRSFGKEYVISFIKHFINYKANSEISSIQIDVNYEDIKNIVESINLDKDGYIFIVDKDERIIYSKDDRFLGKKASSINEGFDLERIKKLKNEQYNSKYLVVNQSLNEVNWDIFAFIPTKQLYIEAEQMNKNSLSIIIILIGLALLVSFLLSRMITIPITNIVKVMEKVKKGNFHIFIAKQKNRDLNIFAEGFNKMIFEIDSLMKNVIKKEKEKTRVELKALQSQINLHFLYNTLNSIKWMALGEGSQGIANAIVALIKILEYTGRNSEQIVPIEEELEFIRNYITVQKMRYGNKFEMTLDITDEIYKYGILKLTLQPIIENSIIHAFNNMQEGGIIRIEGYIAEKEDVVITIRDNGSGVDLKSTEKFTGMGISNVDTRLKLHFGEKYGITVEGEVDRGTKSTIVLPKLEGGRGNV